MAKKDKTKRRRMGLRRKSRVVPGAAPGHIDVDPGSPPPKLQAMAFGPDTLEERTLESVAEVDALRKKHPTVWLQVVGLGDAAVLKSVRQTFGLHALALEDVVNQGQRTKFEDYETHLYLTLQALGADGSLPFEQVNIFFGPGFVVTFQDQTTGRWDAVRDRIRRGRTRIRSQGADYLAYGLTDAVVDQFFPLAEQYLDTLTVLEEEIVTGGISDAAARIAGLKHELLALRRAVFPLRDVIGALLRDDSDLVADATDAYLRDALDHALQLIELVETARELSTNLMNVHLSVVGYRTNEIMRVLTIMASIFIPLTFIAGIYGMNFAPEKSPWNMPELHWRWGYPAVLLLMAAIAIGLLVYFRRRGWLGGGRRD